MTGEQLRKLRKDLRLKQHEMAERLEVTREYLSRLESSKDRISTNLSYRVNSLFEASEPTIKSTHPVIKYYDIESSGSPMEIFEDNPQIQHIELDLPGYTGATLAINISGHALYPTIESGSIAICKKVADKELILYGELYFLVTEDYRFARRVKRSNKKGHILCVADNHNGRDSKTGNTYQDIEIPIEKIKHLYIIMGSIRRHQS